MQFHDAFDGSTSKLNKIAFNSNILIHFLCLGPASYSCSAETYKKKEKGKKRSYPALTIHINAACTHSSMQGSRALLQARWMSTDLDFLKNDGAH